MLSGEQLIITAYITPDGVILCRDCGESAKLLTKYAVCDYAMQSDFPEGAFCDECSHEIVEPEADEDEG